VTLNLKNPSETWLVITPFVTAGEKDPAFAAKVFDDYNSFLMGLTLSTS